MISIKKSSQKLGLKLKEERESITKRKCKRRENKQRKLFKNKEPWKRTLDKLKRLENLSCVKLINHLSKRLKLKRRYFHLTKKTSSNTLGYKLANEKVG